MSRVPYRSKKGLSLIFSWLFLLVFRITDCFFFFLMLMECCRIQTLKRHTHIYTYMKWSEAERLAIVNLFMCTHRVLTSVVHASPVHFGCVGALDANSVVVYIVRFTGEERRKEVVLSLLDAISMSTFSSCRVIMINKSNYYCYRFSLISSFYPMQLQAFCSKHKEKKRKSFVFWWS